MMNERGNHLNPKFNSKHMLPLKPHKTAQAPNVVNRTNTPFVSANPKAKIPKSICPKGSDVCHCHPKTMPKH